MLLQCTGSFVSVDANLQFLEPACLDICQHEWCAYLLRRVVQGENTGITFPCSTHNATRWWRHKPTGAPGLSEDKNGVCMPCWLSYKHKGILSYCLCILHKNGLTGPNGAAAMQYDGKSQPPTSQHSATQLRQEKRKIQWGSIPFSGR